MSITLSASKRWGLLRKVGMLWTEWGWWQGPSMAWTEQGDAREMLMFRIKHWRWWKLQRAGLHELEGTFLWTGNLFNERVTWLQNTSGDIIPLLGQNTGCSLLRCHSEKQLRSSLFSLETPCLTIGSISVQEDQNPLPVPICISTALQDQEWRGRSREQRDCSKQRQLMSYRIAFSLPLNQPRLAGFLCCSCCYSIPGGTGAFPGWQFQQRRITSFTYFTLLLAYVGHPWFSLVFVPCT